MWHILSIDYFAKACNETIPHCTNCTSMDVCRVFGPVQNLTCHDCEENFYVGNDKASCKCKFDETLNDNIFIISQIMPQHKFQRCCNILNPKLAEDKKLWKRNLYKVYTTFLKLFYHDMLSRKHVCLHIVVMLSSTLL